MQQKSQPDLSVLPCMAKCRELLSITLRLFFILYRDMATW